MCINDTAGLLIDVLHATVVECGVNALGGIHHLILRDDQGRGQADDVLVGGLGQHSTLGHSDTHVPGSDLRAPRPLAGLHHDGV